MRWALRFSGLLVLGCALACATLFDQWIPIPPSEFHFVPIIITETGEPSGWKVARLVITLVRKQGRTARSITCRVQVEVPGMNWQGVVTDEAAQLAAASASDVAAERVLGLSLLSAEMCRRYYEEMERALRLEIAGARVKDFADYPGPFAPRR